MDEELDDDFEEDEDLVDEDFVEDEDFDEDFVEDADDEEADEEPLCEDVSSVLDEAEEEASEELVVDDESVDELTELVSELLSEGVTTLDEVLWESPPIMLSGVFLSFHGCISRTTAAATPITPAIIPTNFVSGIFPNTKTGGLLPLFEGADFGGTYAPLYVAPQFLQNFSESYISCPQFLQ